MRYIAWQARLRAVRVSRRLEARGGVLTKQFSLPVLQRSNGRARILTYLTIFRNLISYCDHCIIVQKKIDLEKLFIYILCVRIYVHTCYRVHADATCYNKIKYKKFNCNITFDCNVTAWCCLRKITTKGWRETSRQQGHTEIAIQYKRTGAFEIHIWVQFNSVKNLALSPELRKPDCNSQGIVMRGEIFK